MALFGFSIQKILARKLRKEFHEGKIKSLDYNNLEKIMLKYLHKMNGSELNETKIDAEMIIQHMELHNFDNFIAIRLAYYAITLGIIAIVFSSTELLNDINIEPKYIIGGICTFMSVVIISHNLMSASQKENLVYYRFKLRCIEKIEAEKKKDKGSRK